MPFRIHQPHEETIASIEEAIKRAIDDAQVEVRGEGGHFEIRVVSARFQGQSRLAKQRLVYSAIGHLMKGDNPPVHAVDRLETVVS
jgi:acid stress-induced BolA-like protein IbaG/YrbA